MPVNAGARRSYKNRHGSEARTRYHRALLAARRSRPTSYEQRGHLHARRVERSGTNRLRSTACRRWRPPRPDPVSGSSMPGAGNARAQLLADLGCPLVDAGLDDGYNVFEARSRPRGPRTPVLHRSCLASCHRPPSRAPSRSSRLIPSRPLRNADQVIAGRKSDDQRSMGRSSRTHSSEPCRFKPLRRRLRQSSHPFPHHTGHCSLINP